MVRRCMVLIIGFIVCTLVFSGCSTRYATKNSVDVLGIKLAVMENDLKETSAQIRDEVKALHARVEGSYQGSIASEALAQAKVAEQLRNDTRQSLAMMEEKARSVSLDKKEIVRLRRDLDTMRAESEARNRNLVRFIPLDFYEGMIAYLVGVEDDLTLSTLANHCKFPLRKLM
ncbi:MAG: hypothetical protein JRC60_07745, partial [Deltaproteobacteria bacterium]|nr:hypothetical protein [Deltaproteobacteria bacterium]